MKTGLLAIDITIWASLIEALLGGLVAGLVILYFGHQLTGRLTQRERGKDAQDRYRADVFALRLALADFLRVLMDGSQADYAHQTTLIAVRSATLELDMESRVKPFLEASRHVFRQGKAAAETFLDDWYVPFDAYLDDLYTTPPDRDTLAEMRRRSSSKALGESATMPAPEAEQS